MTRYKLLVLLAAAAVLAHAELTQAEQHAHVIAAGDGGRVEWAVLGFSVRGRPIHGWYFNRGEGPPALVFAGIHGDERTAVELGRRLRERWVNQPQRLEGRRVILVPAANPDGVEEGTRHNARGVDLNRNFPVDWRHIRKGDYSYGGHRPLSEPESRVLAALVAGGVSGDMRTGGSQSAEAGGSAPAVVVSIHSRLIYGGGVNNFDGPADALAVLMAACNGYPVWREWRYRTPGSFGRYAGGSMHIPTLTLELPIRITEEREWEANMQAVEAVIISRPPAR
ncbi:MAG: DUF2817 domain-containing protein [Spirochaetota bacterium]